MPDGRDDDEYRVRVPPAIAAPGLIVRASYALGGDQNNVLQFELAIDSDDEAETERKIGLMTRIGHAQRARYELPGLRRQRKAVQAKTDDNVQRRMRMEAEIGHFKEDRLEKARLLDQRFKKLTDDAYDAHVRSGRQSNFVPQGSTKSKLEALAREQESLAAPVDKREQDLLMQLPECKNEIEQGERALQQLDELIGEAEALARGEDISGVE